ncbi:MAG TPA: GNAT family N-acetyltransferase [Gemmataceae bacterium]|jgi:GNAT superfamily N-acetyltransferase|nr:GNAT family N-acetyltransferase [Gemmataceae bacterium]
MLVLREGTNADVPALVRLVCLAFEEYRGWLDPPTGAHQETEEHLAGKMARGGAVLATLAGADIGCVIYEREPDHLYASRLAVLPSSRRQGVGRALMDYVEDKARSLGLNRVRLGVRLALPRLHAYYEGSGYQAVEYRTHAGYSQPTYVMLEKVVGDRTAAAAATERRSRLG